MDGMAEYANDDPESLVDQRFKWKVYPDPKDSKYDLYELENFFDLPAEEALREFGRRMDQLPGSTAAEDHRRQPTETQMFMPHVIRAPRAQPGS